MMQKLVVAARRKSRALNESPAVAAALLLHKQPSGSCGAELPRHLVEGWDVLETIAIILIILWLLGMVSGYTLGNFIWVLLVIAVVLFVVRLVRGRRVV